MQISAFVDRLQCRWPDLLVDRVLAHEPGQRLVAAKYASAAEEYFQGHFPGAPIMPGVLVIEALTQSAALLLVSAAEASGAPAVGVTLRAVEDARFRRPVVPGDRLELEVQLVARRGPVARVAARASMEGQVVAEARLVFGVGGGRAVIDPSARVSPGAVIGQGSTVGPHAVIGPHVVIGRRAVIGASAVIDGDTVLGDDCRVYPFASIGLPPQDLKFAGERTRLVIGSRNVFRECVTIHRGTVGGGGQTTIGDDNLFMAYAHVAHDCHVGSHTIFGNAATLGGHVTVEDYAAISAYSGVHQFCRIGQYAFIGGYSVVTRDALPFAKTVGNRARIYGLNTIGLLRRGFSEDTVRQLKRAFRYLLVSRLTSAQALAAIDGDATLTAPEVAHLVTFIRQSPRGVILRRASRPADGTDDAS